MGVLYFAYGSNIAEDVISGWCPGTRHVGAAELRNHRLAFTRRSIRTHTGVADIMPSPGASVWGALYDLNQDSLGLLDRKEGHGWAYRRVPVAVFLVGASEPTKAMTYRVLDPEATEIPPSAEYLDLLLRAARERELPHYYVEHLRWLRRTSPRA